VNPAAGGGRTARLWPLARARLRRLGLEGTSVETRGPGDAAEAARQAAREGCPLVVAVGGDGTVSEVADGLRRAGGAAALGCLFTGRGSDGRRNFAFPRRLAGACRRLVEGRDRPVDLGLVSWAAGGTRSFLGAAGAGLDAAAAERAQAGTRRGTWSYLGALLGTLATYENRPVRVGADGRTLFEGRAAAVVVANAAHYGGGMKIAPGADPADGWLDVIVLGDLGVREILCWTPAVYLGRHLANPKVTAARGRLVTVESAASLPVHLDGEVAGRTPIRVEVLPGALRLRA
jgi:diacylglycerol kinase (ATP)